LALALALAWGAVGLLPFSGGAAEALADAHITNDTSKAIRRM
jgi:hypothetical protein